MKMTQLYVFVAAVGMAVVSVTLAVLVEIAMGPLISAFTDVA
ncbi:MAG: hypothetical protein ABFS39_08065 [Pseudomonadota bacterium]